MAHYLGEGADRRIDIHRCRSATARQPVEVYRLGCARCFAFAANSISVAGWLPGMNASESCHVKECCAGRDVAPYRLPLHSGAGYLVDSNVFISAWQRDKKGFD